MADRWQLALLAGLLTVGAAHAGDGLDRKVEALWEARLYDQALRRLEAALEVEPERAMAHRLLAESYAKGLGVPQDPVRQLHHLRQSARGGDVESMYALGEAYASGNAVPRSAMSALRWFEAAAGQHPAAAFRYAEIHLANEGQLEGRYEPVERLRFAVGRGLASAQYLLATLLVAGDVPALDGEDAEALLEQAAETLPEARTALGVIHHRRGTHSEAKALFRAAHADGDPSAAAYLGHYAEAGIQGPVDRTAALNYYRDAITIPWAKAGAERIEAHNASIEVLGIRIYGATRPEVRRALIQRGFRGLGGEAHYDAFDVSKLFEAAERGVLTAGYAPGSPAFLAELHYRFETPDPRQARMLMQEIDRSLRDRYGEADNHTRELGTQIKQWQIGEIELQLRFVPRERRLHVTYHLEPFIDQLAAFLEAQSALAQGAGNVF